MSKASRIAIEALTDTGSHEAVTAFLERLYGNRDQYLERDRYASIGNADRFYTKVVGVTFDGRQNIVAGITPKAQIELQRQPENPFDPNAIAVCFGALQLGFIRREIARRIAPNIDAGDRYLAQVASVTGGTNGTTTGVNIFVSRQPRMRRAGSTTAKGHGNIDPGGVRRALIGDRQLRPAQVEVINRLERGLNTLAIFGTGRGKSLCFQLPAAEAALEEQKKTLVFHPLRALANDQYEALQRRLHGLGLRILRANGSIDADERAELYEAMESGAWDILLVTPEFATFHSASFALECNKPDLVVVDEAHHIYESRHRAAYRDFGKLLKILGNPQVLALTATASKAAFEVICATLNIQAWIIDPTVRENLQIVDSRNTRDKTAYLSHLVRHSLGKVIVYTNSRIEAVKTAERLRETEKRVAFYHAGVPTEERRIIEDLFRNSQLDVVVATSAFGEGIDLPDVRHLVLYHLNFDFAEYNQMGGRAGRDGKPASIHLLYGENDRRINDYILSKAAPSLEKLRSIYLFLRKLDNPIRMTYEQIAQILDLEATDASTVGSSARIFEELGLLDTGNDDEGRFIRILPCSEKVDIESSSRYAEGVAERECFNRFCQIALDADAATLQVLLNRPMYPDGIALQK
jgi:single-stranded-DNA-specific exonuclease